jgi:predicted RecB family nuclease
MRTITSEILVAYSQCYRKAFLLSCTDERGLQHDYVRVLEQRRKANLIRYTGVLTQQNNDIKPYTVIDLDKGNDVLTEAILKVEGMEAYCDILRKTGYDSTTSRYIYEPTIVVGTYGISKEQKLDLLFAGYALGEIQGTVPLSGSLVGMGGQVHKLKLGNGRKALRPLIDPLSKWLTAPPSNPPQVILCKHCSYCQFRHLCQDKAEKDDDLSLLDRMTPKLIKRYHDKGIFTVKQLSFLYKPRKNRKQKKKTVALHKLELQALAIRTGKIYIQELPELPRNQVELFLDIEGIPDQNFYYLLGLLVCDGDNRSYHFFWANTPQDEAQIWCQLLEKMGEYPEVPIYHYGSYEPKAIRQMAKRYQADYEGLKKRLVNLNGYIYGKVYFPVKSNSLKGIGNFIGASWASPDASGLQSLVWRHHWEETQETEYKQLLIAYNQEDCIATKLLADELRRICNAADSHPDIDFADQPKQVVSL